MPHLHITSGKDKSGIVKLTSISLAGMAERDRMGHEKSPLYHRHRFPPEVISHCVWLYYRFSLSYRDIELMMAERGLSLTYETIRYWCLKFGMTYARKLKAGKQCGDTWHLDEVYCRIGGEMMYL